MIPVRLGAVGALGRAVPWFPVVGAVLGAVGGGVRYGLEPLVGAAPATVVALICLVALTGALHLDGLADTADGLGVRGDRPRRLAAMRDSAIGVFGALALIGWALLMISALGSFGRRDALAALIVAAALGRWAAVVHAALTRPARAEGLGAGFAVGRAGLAIATALAVAAVAVACLVTYDAGGDVVTAPPVQVGDETYGFLNVGVTRTYDLGSRLGAGAAAAAAAAIVAAAWSWATARAFGGRTGDTLGASVALVEAVVCLVLVGFWAA